MEKYIFDLNLILIHKLLDLFYFVPLTFKMHILVPEFNVNIQNLYFSPSSFSK